MTPAEEYRKAITPWVRCAWCGTLRPPATLDDQGACLDTKWCSSRETIVWREADFRDALMAWPRDYPAAQSTTKESK